MEVKSGTALITITMVLGVLMDGIDGSLVNVALPSIAYSFGTDTSVVSWVRSAFPGRKPRGFMWIIWARSCSSRR